ncbi:MAG: phosphate ABC transporter substrate-binding protein PstS [Actinobacteria bacterium]|nr:phosphate ABC transporter substrate-binding protein PstS [Actinomycetota bacterium]
MKLNRAGIAAGLLATAVTLAACGSDSNNTTSSSSAPAGGGGSSSASPSATAPAVKCATGTLNADGSTAQANAMTQWIKDYQNKCSGTTVVYAGGGSGQGVTDFNGNKVDFAGSDAALDPAKGELAAATTRCGSPAVDLPMVVGPVAIAYKLNGVSSLTLTPDVLAKIFLGKVTTWNDDAIKSINKNANLPSTPITVFYRSDQSGTTQNFETYLKATDPTDFTATPSKVWAGTVGQGKSGSQGVQQAVQATEGAIAYDEFSYAVSGNLQTAAIDNGGGAVQLSAKTASAAVNSATVVGTGDDLSLKLDYATKTPGAYPIILVTYEITCTKYADSAKGALVQSFLSYTSGPGQDSLIQLGYAPLPQQILSKVQTVVAKIS